MSALRDCIKRAGKLLSPANGEALLTAQKQLVADGYSAAEAARSALQTAIDTTREQLDGILKQLPVDPRIGASKIGRFIASSIAELPQDEKIQNDGGERTFPIGVFTVTRAGGRESRLPMLEVIWPMFVAAYEKKGMMYANRGEMIQDRTLFDVYRNAAGEAVAFSIKKITPYGYKGTASGTNGTPEGKAAVYDNLRELGRPGNYAELSAAPLHIAVNKLGITSVPVSEVAAVLGGKTITPEADGFSYSRAISGLTVATVKRMVGMPVLWKTQKPVPPNSALESSPTSPSSSGNSSEPTSQPNGAPTSSKLGATSENLTGKTPTSSSLTELRSAQGRAFTDQDSDQLLFLFGNNSRAETASPVEPAPASAKIEPASGTKDLVAQEAKDVTPILTAVDAPTPAEEKKSESAPVTPKPESPEAISDFGEKIDGARKDVWSKWVRAMEEGLPSDVKEITLAKHFPEPDYAKAIDAGANIDNLATIAALRSLIPRKPQSPYKLSRWGELVRNLHRVMQSVVDEKFSLSTEKIDAILKKTEPYGGPITSKITLFRKLGFPTFQKANEWNIETGAFSVFNGQRYEKPTNTTYATKDGRTYYEISSQSPNRDQAFDEVAEKLKAILSALPEETKSQETKFGIYQDRYTQDFFVGKKGLHGVIRIKTGFKTAKDVRTFLTENRAELEKKWEEMKAPPQLHRAANLPRKGMDRRPGDVSPEEFQQTFGFRGVQFGNYVEGTRRQSDLNEAFDALIDMSEAIGVTPKALSLDGFLALSFGARGVGGHRAHFEPGEIVINITKTKGPGTMAHEWFHALDNYFARLDRTGDTKTKNLDAYATRDVAPPANMRPIVWKAFKAIRDALSNGTFSARSAALDATRSKPYFGTTIEKSARAFEIYIEERLALKGIANDYLVNAYKPAGDRSGTSAYPTTAEMDSGIRAAFDSLFNALEEKDGKLLSGRATIDPNQLQFEELTQEEIASVDKAIADATRAEMIRENVKLADKIANQFRIPGLDDSDIRQEARAALITASREYDQAKGPFAPYAGMVIRNRLRDLFKRNVRRVQTQGVSADQENEQGATIVDTTAGQDDTRAVAELSETRRLLLEAVSALPDRLRAILEASAAGKSFSEIGAEQGITRERVRQLAENGMAFVRARLKRDGVRSMDRDGILASSQADDEAAIADLMRELAADTPSGAIDEAAREGAGQLEGQQTIGRPDLANPAGPDAQSRNVLNAVDEARKETMERETHDQWRAEAVNMIARDRAGVLRDLLSKAQDGVALDNAVQVKAAQLLVNDLIQQAVSTKNPETMRQAQVLAWSYREGGTEQARAFAARRDPFKRPADRYREFLAGAVFTPSPKLRKELKSAWSPAEKQRRIAALNKQLADARAEVLTLKQGGQTTVPADVQQRITRINVALGEAIQTKDRVETLNSALTERMKKIEGELSKMGVTLDDIFGGEAYLRLRGGAIDNNIFDAANYDTIKRRALSLVKKGWSNDYVAKKTGLSAAQVAKFEQEHIDALRARLEKLGDAALDVDKLDTLNLAAARARLAAGEAGLSAEERKKRIDAMISAMGYGRGAQREQRTKRAPATPRRKPDAKPAPATPETATEPGSVPAYPGATGQSRPNRGNRQLDLEETGNEQPTGATLPDATGRPAPEDFAGPDAAPPVFDISDPIQVAQAVRAIHAADANGFDMATEFWVNSVLSGPLTQGANIIGNTANTVWDFTFKRFGEAAVNAMVGDSNAPQMGEFKHMLRATQPALARAWRNALRTWTAETSMFENDVLNQQLDLVGDFDKSGPTRAAIAGKPGQLIRIPGRLLMATDDFFKSFIAHTEAAAQGYRIAKSEGLTGQALESRIAGLINLPGSAAWLAAVKKAEELTFQDKHEDKPAGKLLRLLSTIREFDVGGGVKPMRFVLPFVRTPFNIFGQGLRQSPAGMALLLGRFARAGFYKMKNGRPVTETYPRPDMIRHTVEQLIAWTTAAIVFGAAAGDDDDETKPILITGSVPYTDAGSNALNQRAGNQPFSIRVGDVIVSYGRVEPFATILGTTIDMIRAGKASSRDKASFDAVGALMQSLSQQTEEKTFLRGISDLIGAAKGERKGERENYLANFLASWVPNLFRQPLRELDPVYRERGGGFVERLATNVVPQIAPAKVDVYGETAEKPGLAGWRALVPIAVRSAPDVNRVDRLLNNWFQSNPEDKWAPLPLSRTLRLNQKETRQLTGPELSEYSIRAGRLAAQMLRNAALNVEKPTEKDIERVKSAFTTARTITRRQMFGARAQEIESK